MKNEEYIAAYILYSEALNKAQSEEYKVKFLLNKAIVCYKINLLK
jgi:fructose-bisphosphate aldolase class 1